MRIALEITGAATWLAIAGAIGTRLHRSRLAWWLRARMAIRRARPTGRGR